MVALTERDVRRRFDLDRAPWLEAPLPRIERRDIEWRGGVGDAPLEIRLTLENPSRRAHSAPCEATVDVAEFGAFLPWKPLARVLVPAIPPGGRKLLTATAAAGDLPRPPKSRAKLLSLLRDAVPAGDSTPAAFWNLFPGSGSVPDLERLRDAHFVGNLNVFVSSSRPVERHCHTAIGLCAGRPNVAWFCVGDGRRDVYTLSPRSLEPGWRVELLGFDWNHPIRCTSVVLPVSITPPERADTGALAIDVTRHSSRVTVPVEFELETRVSGSKCFFF